MTNTSRNKRFIFDTRVRHRENKSQQAVPVRSCAGVMATTGPLEVKDRGTARRRRRGDTTTSCLASL
eukprot:547233-Hanusia_phi.AAC.1